MNEEVDSSLTANTVVQQDVGETNLHEVRRHSGQHVPSQSNTQTSTGQHSSSQYTTQASSTIQDLSRSSPHISRISSQATQQQAYQSTNQQHGPVQYLKPQTDQPRPPRGSSVRYLSVNSQSIQRRGKN